MPTQPILSGFKVVSTKRRGEENSPILLACPWVRAHENNPMIYLKNEWVYRKGPNGPLAVFTTLEYAANFISHHSSEIYQRHIFKCDYILSNETVLYYVYTDKNEEHYNTVRRLLPRGTSFADAVKITEHITTSLY